MNIFLEPAVGQSSLLLGENVGEFYTTLFIRADIFQESVYNNHLFRPSLEVVTLQMVKRKTKNGSGLVEKLSNLYQRMSTSGSLNPEKIIIAEETYETGAGSSKNENVNVPTLERSQHKVQKIIYASSILIRKSLTTLMELPIEVGSKEKVVWPII